MNGHKLYEYALKLVPPVIKTGLEKAGLVLSDMNKLLIHQANQKMDLAILERLGALYGVSDLSKDLMPNDHFMARQQFGGYGAYTL